MKIIRVTSRIEHFELSRPYEIAFRSVEAVDNGIVLIETDAGITGWGAASPEPFVTGETIESCEAALAADNLDWLVGRDVRERPGLCRELGRRMASVPAARAAVDIAIHDCFARFLGLPLADALGRAHESLPTSITIGIKPAAETIEEAREYVGRGFTVLKVKGGHALAEDLDRLRRLRAAVGPEIRVRVDPNQGYTAADVLAFERETRDLGIEFLEQPTAARDLAALRNLPETIREKTAADESLLTERDAISLLEPPRACGIFNIKLMKAGGIFPARRIAAIAEAAGVDLMWGCMDESRISISAALHAAFSSPATRYLDLDGSFDLARDVVSGGFVLEAGRLRTTNEPGLGILPL